MKYIRKKERKNEWKKDIKNERNSKKEIKN